MVVWKISVIYNQTCTNLKIHRASEISGHPKRDVVWVDQRAYLRNSLENATTCKMIFMFL